MEEEFFHERLHSQFPLRLYDLALDSFALVRCWEPYQLTGPARGRMFENIFCRYCGQRGLPLSEEPGSRTLCGEKSASGFKHESDAVIALPDLLVHVEFKYLTEELNKNELLIFNQKGLDFLAAGSSVLRRRPLYRLVISGRAISEEARRFALQWGILTVEPDRLPLLVVLALAGCYLPGLNAWGVEVKNQIRNEISHIISPLQNRMRRLVSILSSEESLISERRLDRILNVCQLRFGEACWSAMDEFEPKWLEERYDSFRLGVERQHPSRFAMKH